MATVQYVASCWLYDRLCTLSLSQFVLHPPVDHTAIVTVCYCLDQDPRTAAVLDWFAANHSPPNVVWDWQHFSQRRLMRRAIARNRVCQSTTADYVLLADIDYMPGPGAIDATVAAMAKATAESDQSLLMYPRYVQSSVSHEAGDREIQRVDGPFSVRSLDRSLYQRSRLSRPIGGCLWITGDTARKHGYIPDHKRHQRAASRWLRTTCDVSYKKSLSAAGYIAQPLPVDSWYRVRHGKRGRENPGIRL